MAGEKGPEKQLENNGNTAPDVKKAESVSEKPESEVEKQAKEEGAKKAAAEAEARLKDRTDIAKINQPLNENQAQAKQLLKTTVDFNDSPPDSDTLGLISGRINDMLKKPETNDILTQIGLNDEQNLNILKKIIGVVAKKCVAKRGYEGTEKYAQESLLPALTKLKEIGEKQHLQPKELLKKFSAYVERCGETGSGLVDEKNILMEGNLKTLLLTENLNGFIEKFGESLQLENERTQIESVAKAQETAQNEGKSLDVKKMIEEGNISFSSDEIVLSSNQNELTIRLKEAIKNAIKPANVPDGVKQTIADNLARPEAIAGFQPGEKVTISNGKLEKVEGNKTQPATPEATSEKPQTSTATTPANNPEKTLPNTPQPQAPEGNSTSAFLKAADAFKKGDLGTAIALAIEGLLTTMGIAQPGIGYTITEWLHLNKLNDKQLALVHQWTNAQEDEVDLGNCAAYLKKYQIPDPNLFLANKKMREVLMVKRKDDNKGKSWGDFTEETWSPDVLARLKDSKLPIEDRIEAMTGKVTPLSPSAEKNSPQAENKDESQAPSSTESKEGKG